MEFPQWFNESIKELRALPFARALERAWYDGRSALQDERIAELTKQAGHTTERGIHERHRPA